MNNYLIPANTKKGQLILGIFRPFDLILFLSGVSITVLLLIILPLSSTIIALMALLPALICAFLVMPLPYYHNILNVFVEMYEFFTTQRRYKWRGWCFKYENSEKK